MINTKNVVMGSGRPLLLLLGLLALTLQHQSALLTKLEWADQNAARLAALDHGT